MSPQHKALLTAAFAALGPERVTRGLQATGHSWIDCFLAIATYGEPGAFVREVNNRSGRTGANDLASNLIGVPLGVAFAVSYLKCDSERRILLEGPMEARVTSQSQPFRLMARMEEAKVLHGQEVRADLPNVRVTALAGSGEGQALFCTIGPIRVREVLHRGDNQPLPTDVTVQGLAVPMAGTYDIFNARVSSNGDIALVVDDKTWLVPAVKENGFDGSYAFS